MAKSKEALIISAEREFGAVGIEGASLRTISENAGYKNVYAAQYHFKNKDGLIEAIFRFRRPILDIEREKYFRIRNISVAEASLYQLTEAIFLPLFTQVDENGIRSYVRFLQVFIRGKDNAEAWAAVADAAPVTGMIIAVIRRKLVEIEEDLWLTRRRLLHRFAVDAIADFDRKGIKSKLTDLEYFDEIINLTVQAFQAKASN